MRYEIRFEGETKCVSELVRCGYSKLTLKRMLDAGYRYYIDGKYQKKAESVNGQV